MRIRSLGWSDDFEKFPAFCAKIRALRDSAIAPTEPPTCDTWRNHGEFHRAGSVMLCHQGTN